jgi:hypothetical protein|tara:strand:+ start:303 stop:509 length:207 start_codon:yes stop_codon:yes gene_type:complete
VGILINNKNKEVEMATINVKSGDKIVIANENYVAAYIDGAYVIVKDDEAYAEHKKMVKYYNDCDAGRV